MQRLYHAGQIEDLLADGIEGAAVTTAAAAELAGVAQGTVRAWATRGKLPLAGYDAEGRAYYRARDVLAVERATRRACAGRPRLQH